MALLDYAHPIRDNTREEVFAAPISNCLFNTNEAIYQYLLQNKDRYSSDLFTHMEDVEKDSHRRFVQFTTMSEWEFLFFLKYGEEYLHHSYDEFMETMAHIYVDIRMRWDPIQYAQKTNFLGAITHLLNLGTIKTLYIYDEMGKYDKAIQALIALTFDLTSQDHHDVELLHGSAWDMYTSEYYEKITTMAIDSNEDLFVILQDMEDSHPEDFKKKYFIIPRLKVSNFDENSVKVTSARYWLLNHHQEYLEMEKRGHFYVGQYTVTEI